jgi:LacI family transcriptional regulator
MMLTDDQGSAEAEMHAAQAFVATRVAGVILTALSGDVVEYLLRQHVAVVEADRQFAAGRCDAVVIDNAGAARRMTEHLLELGHRRIAFIGGVMYAVCVADRLLGARKAMATAGSDPELLTVIETAGLSIAEGRRAGERLLALPRRRRPTAAFCANDLVALGLLQHLTQAGVAVPAELALVGYDDIEFAGAAAVPLTSVRQPRRDLGRRAAELLLAETDGAAGHVHQQVVFPPQLVVRTSSISG